MLPHRTISRWLTVLLALTLLSFIQGQAQDLEELIEKVQQGDTQALGNEPIYFTSGALEVEEGADGVYRFLAAEGVRLWQGDRAIPILELIGDQAVVWVKPQAKKTADPQHPDTVPDPLLATSLGNAKQEHQTNSVEDNLAKLQARLAVAQVYAQGQVQLRWGDNLFSGDELFFDLLAGRGMVLRGALRGTTEYEKRRVPLHLRAQELWIKSQTDFWAKDAQMSTCQFAIPHYHFQASQIHVVRKDQSVAFDLYDNFLYANNLPIFYFPYVGWSTEWDWPLKSVHAGRSSRFGYFLETRWGGTLYKNEELDQAWLKRLRWLFDLDIREKRGLAGGPHLRYEGNWPDRSEFSGQARLYYLHDQPLAQFGDSMEQRPAADDEASWKKLYRFSALHQHHFPDKLSLDIEISYISDRIIMPGFFEDELREEKPPESYAYLKKVWQNHAATALTRYRLNSFQSQIAYLPELTYQMIAEPLLEDAFGPWYVASVLNVSHVKRQDDKQNPTIFAGKHLTRLDWDSSISRKFSLGPLFLLPFAGGRLTYFDEGRDEEHLLRRTGEFGMEVATNFYRSILWDSSLLGIHNLLHIVTPSVRYNWICENTESPSKLIPFDAMESVDRLMKVQLRLTNRLKTFRGNSLVQFLFLDAEVAYYPERDLPELGLGERLDNLKLDFQWQIASDMVFYSRAEYSFRWHDWERASGYLAYNPTPKWQWILDSRYYRHNNFVTTATIAYFPSVQWGFKVTAQYEFSQDFEKRELRDVKFHVQRSFHDFVLDLEIRRDVVDDNTSVVASFYPIDLVNNGLGRGQ